MMRSPFDFEHTDPWSSDLVDVETLNAHVSDVIVARITSVREAAALGPDQLRTSSVLALGPAGSGKTHLFVRIRRKCGPRAAFVLIRPELGVDATPRHVLSVLVDSFAQRASDTTGRQLDVVVGSMLASFLGEKFPHALLDRYKDGNIASREELVARALDEVERRYPEAYLPYIEQLLRAPFLAPVDRRTAMQWLSGREPNEIGLQRLGIPSALGDSDIMPALRSLSIVAAFGAPIVLVFDQLENLFDPDSGAHRVHNYANLISELFDSVRGLVIVQLALEGEWRQRIRPLLSDSQRSRLEATLVELELPRSDQREALVRAWVSRLDEKDRAHPFPWPFSTSLLQEWQRTEGITPRRLMILCREALLAGPEIEPAPHSTRADALPAEMEDYGLDRLEQLWQAELTEARRTLSEVAAEGRGLDDHQIIAGLTAAYHFVAGTDAKTKRVKNVSTIELRTPGAKRTLRVVQQLNPSSIAAVLRHAAEDPQSKQLVILRERVLSFAPTWRKVEEYARAFSQAAGRLLWMEREEVAQLLAVHAFLSAGRSQDLTRVDGRPFELGEVEAWIDNSLRVSSWPLLQRISSSEHESEATAEVAKIAPPPVPKPEPKAAAQALITDSSPNAPDSATLDVLRRLRVASVERVVREVKAGRQELTRAQVLAELRACGPRIRWFGSGLVACVEERS